MIKTVNPITEKITRTATLIKSLNGELTVLTVPIALFVMTICIVKEMKTIRLGGVNSTFTLPFVTVLNQPNRRNRENKWQN